MEAASGVFFLRMIAIPPLVDRLAYRYPSVLVDAITCHEPGRRIVAVKNVTVNEEFFQGHFPGTPLMPGVLMIESLTQVATLLLAGCDTEGRRARLRAVENAKFRRQVVPGDRLELDVTMGRRRGNIARAGAVASVDGHVVAEAELVMAIEPAVAAAGAAASAGTPVAAAGSAVSAARPVAAAGAAAKAGEPGEGAARERTSDRSPAHGLAFGERPAPAGAPVSGDSAGGTARPAAAESSAPAAVAEEVPPRIHDTAIVHPGAVIGPGTIIEPHAIVGANVVIGRHCRVGASSVIDGDTTIGDYTEIYPFASVGLAPQDLKFRGERTRLVIGERNVFREFVTIHRGTAGGGGVTTIGDRNLFMAYAHVAHDCQVGHSTIFGNGATIGGHVTVEDFATISAYSGVHQFCRVGKHAFIGGYTVVTRDALPFARTVGNRARIYGVNTIGLARRGFSQELIGKLRRAYRHLVQHNTSRALELIERDGSLVAPEVSYLVNFITSAQRGVILRRPSKRVDDLPEPE
jgi:UDP-N-acetylglucosamine acyltransferase